MIVYLLDLYKSLQQHPRYGEDNSNTFIDTSEFNSNINNVGTTIILGNRGIFNGSGYIY